MSHHCSTLILHCIDFRLGKSVKKYLEDNGLLGDADTVSVAGAAKNIASPQNEPDAEFVLRQIDISKRLHGITTVILMNHTDCGAYGGRAAFASDADEKEKHADDMKKSEGAILVKYPDLHIKKVLAKIEEGGEISFENIA